MTRQLREHISNADAWLPHSAPKALGMAEAAAFEDLLSVLREIIRALKEVKKELDWVEQRQEAPR